MAWTTPRTWVVGEVLTAALLNTHLRDDLNYLYAGGERGYSVGALVSLGNDVYVSPTWTSNATGSVVGASNGLTVGVAGSYHCTAIGIFAASAAGSRLALLRKAGVGILEVGLPPVVKASIASVVINESVQALVALDRIDAQFRQDSGGALNLTGSTLVVRRVA